MTTMFFILFIIGLIVTAYFAKREYIRESRKAYGSPDIAASFLMVTGLFGSAIVAAMLVLAWQVLLPIGVLAAVGYYGYKLVFVPWAKKGI